MKDEEGIAVRGRREPGGQGLGACPIRNTCMSGEILAKRTWDHYSDTYSAAFGNIGNETRDVLCLYRVEPSYLEARIRIPPEEIRRRLNELSAFFLRALEQGYGVQLWL